MDSGKPQRIKVQPHHKFKMDINWPAILTRQTEQASICEKNTYINQNEII